MMKVYAFEWCSCVYESGYSIVSLHASKDAANASMDRAVEKERRRDKKFERETGIPSDKPMWSARVRTIKVQP